MSTRTGARALSPIPAYRCAGDVRPHNRQLNAYLRALTDKQKPYAQIVAANVLIDLAVADSRHADEHLLSANNKLATVAQQASRQEKIAHLAVEAQLRRSELEHWKQAAKDETVEISYSRLLSGAAIATQSVPVTARTQDTLAEYIPLLLGARAEERGIGGWAGRLALIREDCGFRDSEANWDCGILLEPTADNFIDPPTKLQVKRGHRTRGFGSYRNAGIPVLRSVSLGLTDPLQVINSLLAEIDCEPDNYKGQLLSSKRLDEVTGNVRIATLGKA